MYTAMRDQTSERWDVAYLELLQRLQIAEQQQSAVVQSTCDLLAGCTASLREGGASAGRLREVCACRGTGPRSLGSPWAWYSRPGRCEAQWRFSLSPPAHRRFQPRAAGADKREHFPCACGAHCGTRFG